MISSSKSDGSKTIKFLYSYGGKILPRRSDGKLRYVGGLTRVLLVPRSISFAELMVKLSELCGSSTTLRCKFPDEDLDILIIIRSDEDLKNVKSEYNRFSKDEKIVAILFPTKLIKRMTPVSSAEDLYSSGSSAASSMKPVNYAGRATCHHPMHRGVSPRINHRSSVPASYYCR